MDDSDEEEFEPLFDYSRIQPRAPVRTIDDKSTGASPVTKKHKGSKTEVEQKQGMGNVKSAVEVVISDDDNEWLAPPPKNLDYNILEDSTLKALRSKRLELASVAQSADEDIRMAKESATKDLNPSFQSSPQSASKQPVHAPPERAMIVVTFQNKNGSKLVRVARDEKFELIFKKYAKSVQLDVNTLGFLFDGEKISPTATPDSLGMEEEDMIEVHIKSR